MPPTGADNLRTGWAFRVATVAGIPIRIHFTFVLILVWVGYSASNRGQNVALSLLLLFLLFTCVVLHELGHALTARRFDVETLEIVLYPIGGVARLKSMPSGKAELLIALAGPAVNLVIAGLLVPVVVALGAAGAMDPTLGLTALPDVVGYLLLANVILFLFNLIPAFPMDGGRILRSALSLSMPEDRATNIAAFVGQAIAIGFALFGLFTNPILILIALFVFLGAGQEAAFVQRRFIVRGRVAREAMITRFEVLAPQDSLGRAVELLLDSYQQDFPVVDAWGRLSGVLSRSAMFEGLAERGASMPVLEVMDREISAVAPNAPMGDVLRHLQTAPHRPVLVVDDGRLEGMITMENLAEFIEVARRAREAPQPESSPG